MSHEAPVTVRPPLAAIPLRQDFLGGVVVTAVAVLGYWLGFDLPTGVLGAMGPGMMPKALSILLGVLGALLLFGSFWHIGERLHRWSLRGPLFLFGAMIVFGLTVRPWGLVAAGPLAIVIAACGSDEVQWRETIVTAVVATAFCVGLFKFALGLPIPLAPWLLGY